MNPFYQEYYNSAGRTPPKVEDTTLREYCQTNFGNEWLVEVMENASLWNIIPDAQESMDKTLDDPIARKLAGDLLISHMLLNFKQEPDLLTHFYATAFVEFAVDIAKDKEMVPEYWLYWQHFMETMAK